MTNQPTGPAQHPDDPYTGSLTPAERIASAEIDIMENGASPADAYRGLEFYLIRVTIDERDLAGDEQTCEFCQGTGRWSEGAALDCDDCEGTGVVESQASVYQAAMRGEG